MNFIYLACILIVLDSAATIEVPDHLKSMALKLHQKCVKASGVSEDLLKRSLDNGLTDERELQCYLHCMLDKIGLIDSDHVVHLENLTEVLPAELHDLVRGLANGCGTKKGADGCETALLTIKCYIDAEPELIKKGLSFLFL